MQITQFNKSSNQSIYLCKFNLLTSTLVVMGYTQGASMYHKLLHDAFQIRRNDLTTCKGLSTREEQIVNVGGR